MSHGVDVERLVATVGADLGSVVVQARAIGGGDINHALRLDLADGRTAFVKSRAGAPPGAFAAEAEGLRWLGQGLVGQQLSVPEVLAWHDPVAAGADAVVVDHGGDDEQGYLALAWVDEGAGGPDHDEALGCGLAALHQAGAAVFGLTTDTTLGSLRLPNDPCDTWAEFYGERRLRPLARRAVDDGAMGPDLLPRIDAVIDRLGDLVGPPEPPARLHGDLWAGNALRGTDRPWLIDPAVYGGHREVDLAMMRLFGGFGPRVFAAYAEAFPLADGSHDRVALYQLHPLLVHAVLFGGSYAAAADRALRTYG